MEQIGKRVKIIGSEFKIASPKNPFMLIFLPIWLTGWTIGGFFAFMQIVSGKADDFMLVWLCGWLLGELFVLYAFLWGAFGYEIISIYQEKLRIKRSIFGYGPIKEFHISKISNLRASGFFGPMMSWDFNMAYWGLAGGTVAFDYDGKTQRFGINLNENNANELVNNLKNKLNL